MQIEVERIRNEFQIFERLFRGQRIAYLDTAATSLKPRSVVNALAEHFSIKAANIHRGVYELSEEATHDFELTRESVRDLISARSTKEIIFTSGTTESINLVASCLGKGFLKAGDEIILSEMEHHSNIVPWQMAAQQYGFRIKVWPMTDSGTLLISDLQALLTDRTKLISVVWVSNSLGTINPVSQICQIAKSAGILTLLDAAQAITFSPVNVRDLGCDFLAFSGHKMFGPTGVGVLYGREELLERLPPYQGGGDMIRSVSFDGTTYNDLPYKFEAGTPNIGGVIAFNEAIKFLKLVNVENIRKHDEELVLRATRGLKSIGGITVIADHKEKGPVVSFVMDNVHPHDLGTFLDEKAVAIRTGHHCTQPVMKRLNIPATARASFSVYNDYDDVDRLVDAVSKAKEMFL